MSFCLSFLGLVFLFSVFSLHGITPDSLDANETAHRNEIIRVIKPGVFDIQTQDFLIRMRAWGVEFPKRGQPGYEAALSFTEKKLISTVPRISIKREFDDFNLKVVDIELFDQKVNFSKEAILLGIGWHNEKETGRFGPYLMAQLKAKRLKTGIWSTGFAYNSVMGTVSPQPKLPTLYDRRQGFIPSLSFWVTSFGKIHRPGCSFYERGRGTLTSKPTGTDCRICGGRYPKK
tara:strand:- start:561 stop:1256 length:696 start_codon:yes stop_codon:yes gene_type:complete